MSKKQSKERRTSPQDPSPANLTYYIVVLIAGISGFMSYSSGASLEGALARVLVVLLACTIVGYFVNLVLWMSAPGRQAAGPAATAAGAPTAGSVGARVDLVAGDDEEETRTARRQPSTPARSPQAAG